MRTALSPRGPVREVGLEFFSGNGKNIVHNNINEVSSEQKGIFSPALHRIGRNLVFTEQTDRRDI